MRRFQLPELVLGFLMGVACLLVIFLLASDLHVIGSSLEPYSAFITAIATIFIAWFTLSLRQSTDKLWNAGERQLTKTQRAFVHIDGFDFEISTKATGKQPPEFFEGEPEWHRSQPELVITRFALQPRWKNSGTTPTKNMTIQVDWRGPEHVPPSEYGYRNDRAPFFLAPMAVEPSEVIEVPTASAIVNWSWFPIHPPPLILIWGRADYEDVFGGTHFVEWCYRLRLSRPVHGKTMSAGTTQWGEYNRSDED
jgi:hypothetical protein